MSFRMKHFVAAGCLLWVACHLDGQSYTFTVDTRLRRGDDYGVSVELQSITKDLYFYLKSFMYFNTADIDDPYAETIQIYSNVDNGWGILGATDGERQVIRF